MKKIVLYIISMTFIANTLVVSASVKLCVQDNMDTPQIEMSSDSEMPCHNEEKSDPQDHCKDACFCPQFAANQLPIIDSGIMNFSATSHKQFSNLEALLISRFLAPIYKPPILLS